MACNGNDSRAGAQRFRVAAITAPGATKPARGARGSKILEQQGNDLAGRGGNSSSRSRSRNREQPQPPWQQPQTEKPQWQQPQ